MFDLCFSTLGYVDYFKYVYAYGMCTLMFANEIKNKKCLIWQKTSATKLDTSIDAIYSLILHKKVTVVLNVNDWRNF